MESRDSIAVLRWLCARAIDDEILESTERSALQAVWKGRSSRQLATILWMRDIGLKDESAAQLRRLLSSLSNVEMARASRGMLRLFYPAVYLKEMRPFLVGDTLIDASFVHAVMRQESAYNPYARSPVGAVGLLQLMPTTAKAVARRNGIRRFRESQLTEPRMNLRLGIAYMQDLARIWNGHQALILANYNAGPGPTRRWKPAFDSLPVEQAAEEITYWETRDYVKKCLGNWWTYQHIHPEMR
jgi:soluble lytic murein transglycosylase